MNEDNVVLRAMRSMAWNRAKGELASMAETYYQRFDGDKFQQFKQEFEAFVAKVEGEGLQE